MAKRKRKNNKNDERYWYPDAAIAANHYVYLTTLSYDNPSLKTSAEEMLKVNKKKGVFEQEANFEESLAFLEEAMKSEKRKEINFLKSKGINGYLTMNYDDLLKKLNIAILGVDEFKRRAMEEHNRYLDAIDGKSVRSYTQGLGSYIRAALNQLRGDSKQIDTSIPGVVRTTLIGLLNKKLSGNMSIEQIATVIGSYSSVVLGEITEKISEGRGKDRKIKDDFLKDGKINQEKIQELIMETKAYKQNFGPESDRTIDEIKADAENIFQNYGIALSKKAKDRIRKKVKDLPRNNAGKIDWKAVQADESLVALADLNEDELYTYTFERNTGKGGEFRTTQDFGDQITSWVGKKGGFSDVVALVGEVVISAKKRDSKEKKIVDDIVNNIDQKTRQEFTERGQYMAKKYEELEQAINEADKELDNLKKSFIIHNNIKDYATTVDLDKDTKNSSFGGFKGGEAWRLNDFINAISGLQNAGFASADIDWLKSCLLNTASESVGASNLDSLQKYLSVFATSLLFDDGITIAQDVAKKAYNQKLNVLHLYPLNGIYFPSSYIMDMILKNLRNQEKTVMQKSIGYEGGSGADVEIDPGKVDFLGIRKELSKNEIWGVKRWETIREKQIEAMSIKIKFMASFMSVINFLAIGPFK